MAKSKKNKNMMYLIGFLAAIVILHQATTNGGFLGAIIAPGTYNGDMEDWCVNDGTETGFGTLDNGVACDDDNSNRISNVMNLPYSSNEIPLYWQQQYGCCMVRSTDAYSGQYSVLISKQTEDDWYGFGLTRNGHWSVPAAPLRAYTVLGMYKLDLQSGRNPSLSMYFYDSNQNELERHSTSFQAAADWSQFEVTALAPANTAFIGWDIWFPVETHADLHLDEVYIDESDQCEPGETANCGSDVGVCMFGTRTCGTDSTWGACVGDVQPITEVCGDNADNDCDGNVDEYCDVTGFSTAEMTSWFDTVHQAAHNNQGTSDSNSPTWWAWDNAPVVEGELNMYLATGDTKYLDFAVANTDTLIGKASDGNNDGLLDWYVLESPVDEILTYSRTLLPMVKFAYIVKDNGLTAYDAKADEYVAFVEDNFIPVYNGWWEECGNLGFWAKDTASEPNNRAAFVGRTHLYLWLITGDQVYYDQSVRYAEKIKSTLLLRTDNWDGGSVPGYYAWNYNNRAGCRTVGDMNNGVRECDFQCGTDIDGCETNMDNWYCAGPLEMSYGNYDVALMVDYYEAGIVFTGEDITRLSNTFLWGIWNDQALVDGAPSSVLNWKGEPEGPTLVGGHWSGTAQAPHWGRLGDYNTQIESAISEIIAFTINHNDLSGGNFYSSPYLCVNDLRGDYGEICVDNDNDRNRATPAYTMSMIGNAMLGPQSLTPLSGTVPTTNTTDPVDEGCSTDSCCQDEGYDAYEDGGCVNLNVVVVTPPDEWVDTPVPAAQVGGNKIIGLLAIGAAIYFLMNKKKGKRRKRR